MNVCIKVRYFKEMHSIDMDIDGSFSKFIFKEKRLN